VNAFDSTYLEWSETGSSPYLSTINYPTAFIGQLDSTTKREGYFDFTNSGSENTETLNNVYVECYLRAVDDIDSGFPALSAYVYDGSTWNLFTVQVNNYVFAWKTVEITSKINSWSKVDGCRVYLSVKCWAEGSITVDCMRLKVISTPSGAWHNAETWRLNLYTLKWSNSETWRINAYTLKWFGVESWRINLHNFAWFVSEIWKLSLHLFNWFNVETWQFNIRNLMWFQSEIWKISVGTVFWCVAEIWSMINLIFSTNSFLVYSIIIIIVVFVIVILYLADKRLFK